MSDNLNGMTIAVLGGTGKEGRGLAFRWARAGLRVLIGSRTPDKAVQTATEIRGMLSGTAEIQGVSNREAAEQANIVVVTVPYAAHAETLEGLKGALAGKTLVDVTVPLMAPKKSKVQMPPAGSAAQEARQILGETAEVAAAFHTIPHETLLSNEKVECEVLVTGTSKETRARALELVKAAELVGWDAGPIENSVVAEGLASVLIHINRQYGSTHAGIRIIGVNQS